MESLQKVLNDVFDVTPFRLGPAAELQRVRIIRHREPRVRSVPTITAGVVEPHQLDEALFANYLYTGGLPDPDLIVRTAAEMRLSNFLIWQSAYSEYFTTETLWPDFDQAELFKALEAFSQRQRRFGKLENA